MLAHDDQNLPPRDRGRAAWTVLIAVSLALTLTWGVYQQRASFSHSTDHRFEQVLGVASASSGSTIFTMDHWLETSWWFLLE